MKSNLVVAFGLVLVLVAAGSHAESQGSFEVEPMQTLIDLDGPTQKSSCEATADCWDGSSKVCFGSSDCSARDSACPIQRGYVECDGTRTYCPVCPGCVTEGDTCALAWECTSPPGCENCFCKPLGYNEGICHCP